MSESVAVLEQPEAIPADVESVVVSLQSDHEAELQKWQDEVKQRAAEVDTLLQKHLICKELATAAKKRYEAAAEELVDFIRRPPQSLPLFDQPTESANPDDAWKSTPICDLGLSEKLTAKLVEAGILAIGGLSAWTLSGKDLTDISGVGEASAEKIREASDLFFSTWFKSPEPSETESTVTIPFGNKNSKGGDQ